MLESQALKAVSGNTPVASIDLQLVCAGQILLVKRNDELLKSE